MIDDTHTDRFVNSFLKFVTSNLMLFFLTISNLRFEFGSSKQKGGIHILIIVSSVLNYNKN